MHARYLQNLILFQPKELGREPTYMEVYLWVHRVEVEDDNGNVTYECVDQRSSDFFVSTATYLIYNNEFKLIYYVFYMCNINRMIM